MSDSDIREWANARGLKVGVRGVIPATVREAYDAEAALDGAPGAWAGAAESLTADPPPMDEPEPPPLPSDDDMSETRPVQPGTPRARPGRLLQLPGRKAKAPPPKGARGPRKPRRPRVPVDRLIVDVWHGLAGLARPLPATSRLLQLQAPLAGLVLEEAIKNTVVDSVLQPFARTGKNAEVLWAMLGAPALVTLAQLRPGEITVILPVLRSALMSMVRIAGPRIAEALKEEREFEAEYGETVEAIMVFLLQGVTVHEGQTEAEAEAEAVTVLHGEMAG